MFARPLEAMIVLLGQFFDHLEYKWKLTNRMIIENCQRRSNDREESPFVEKKRPFIRRTSKNFVVRGKMRMGSQEKEN